MNVNIPPSVCHNEDQRNNIFWWRNIQGTFTSPAYVYQRERLKVPPCSGEPQASPLKPYNYSSAASFSFNSLATRRMSAAKPQSATMRWTSAPGLAWKMRHDGHDVLLCSAVGLTPVSSNKIMQPLECHAYEGKLELQISAWTCWSPNPNSISAALNYHQILRKEQYKIIQEHWATANT